VSMALLFRIQVVEPIFMNAPALIVDEPSAIQKYKEAGESVAKGKNILFGFERDTIREAIEASDPLIRVTNVEAKFPNKVEVKIRERYPVFYIESGVNFAILDYEMHVISKDRTLKSPDGKYPDLIDISGQFTPADEFEKFELGDVLTSCVKIDEVQKVDTLIMMSKLFFSDSYTEADLRHLILTIDFDGEFLQNSLVIKLNDLPEREGFIIIDIRGYKTDFALKLTQAWARLQDVSTYKHGTLTVYENKGANGNYEVSWIPAG